MFITFKAKQDVRQLFKDDGSMCIVPTPIDDLRVTRNNDKRIKLTETQRNEIAARRGDSIHALSHEYGVSRRLIQFIQYPERQQKNKQDRQERGGWRQYYAAEKHRERMQTHRNYKRELVKEGKI